MTISYSLTPNLLPNSENNHRAVTRSTGSVNQEGVIDRMIERGSTVSKADALAVLEEYHEAIISLVLEGYRVNTPGTSYSTSIRGNFTGQSDSFDPSRHSLEPCAYPGSYFRQAIREHGEVQKLETNIPSPNLLQYVDTNSGQTNTTLTPGGMGHVVGHRLRFDPDVPDQGIFFTPTGSDETPARVTVVGKNTPGELMFLVPMTLTTGQYTLSVRALFGQDDVRTGTLKDLLTVA